MASRPAAAGRPAPRLYLVPAPVADAATASAEIAAALDRADVAAVLLRLAPADERTLVNRVKALAMTVQNRGAALLLDGHVDLVGRGGADGAHLTGIAALQAAAPRLKPQRIVGAGGLKTRHDAMLAGEAGADYVMFGEPDAGGRRPSGDAVLERVAWWAELFEIPCVAYAARIDEVTELCSAGADFIAVGAALFADLQDCAAAIASATNRPQPGLPA